MRWNSYLPEFLPILVVNLPSLHVPAPPSPKEKLLSGSTHRRCINAPILLPLASTGCPLSKRIGVHKPEDARDKAQNKPAGPAPTITILGFDLVTSALMSLLF